MPFTFKWSSIASVLGALLVVGVSAFLSGCDGTTTAPASPTATVAAPAPPPPPLRGYTLSGSVTEPGGGPLPGVTITTRPNPGGGPAKTANGMTDGSGHYVLNDVLGSLWIRTSKDGYEGAEQINPYYVDRNRTVDLTMQRVLRIQAGETLDGRVFADDTSWAIDWLFSDDGCDGPCKLVRVVMPAVGTLVVRLSWPEPVDALSMWVVSPVKHSCCGGGTELVASVIASPGEVLLLVNWDKPLKDGSQPFRLQTSVLPPGGAAPASSIVESRKHSPLGTAVRPLSRITK